MRIFNQTTRARMDIFIMANHTRSTEEVTKYHSNSNSDQIWQGRDLRQKMNANEWRKNSIEIGMEWTILIIRMKIGWKSQDHLEDLMASLTMIMTTEDHQDANSLKIIQADVTNFKIHQKTCTPNSTLIQQSNKRE